MTTRLWLVRHGATDWSDAGRFNGWTDVSLNARGRRDASSLRARMRGMRFDGIWSSDLSRAFETATLAGVDAVSDRRLRELDLGALEGLRWEECSPVIRDRLLAFDGFAAPGGESTAQLRARLYGFLAEIGGGDHLLFTHGGVVRALLRDRGSDRIVGPGELVTIEVPAAQDLPAGAPVRDNR